MEETQYQRELRAVQESGGDVEQFKKDWHARACAAYRSKVKTKEDIHAFRAGRIHID